MTEFIKTRKRIIFTIGAALFCFDCGCFDYGIRGCGAEAVSADQPDGTHNPGQRRDDEDTHNDEEGTRMSSPPSRAERM